MASAHTTWKAPSAPNASTGMHSTPFQSPGPAQTGAASAAASSTTWRSFGIFGSTAPATGPNPAMGNAGNSNIPANASSSGAESNSSASAAHRLLSRFEGFDSAKLSARTNDLERRYATGQSAPRSGMAAAAMGGTGIGAFSRGREEEKKDGEPLAPPVARGAPAMPTDGETALTSIVPTTASRDLLQLVRTSTSLSHLLSTHHDLCIRSALSTAERLEKERWERRSEENAARDWEEERRALLANGGGQRFLSRALVPFESREEKEMNIVPSPQILTQAVWDQLSFHSEAITRYLNSCRAGVGKADAALELITALRDGIDSYSTSMAANESALESTHQYSNGLSLVEAIVLVSGNNNSSYRRGKVRNDTSTKTARTDSDVATGVVGACRFFSQQFRTHMIDVVREVQLDGTYTAATNSTNYNSMTSVARDATAFSTIVLGQTANSCAGVWSTLFYCLRCGDLVAAQSVLQYASPGTEAGVDSVVVELVSMLATMQGEEDSIFGGSRGVDSPSPSGRQTSTLLSPSNTMTRARRAVSDLYEGLKTRYATLTQEQPLAAYRAACLAMLGGNESISEASIFESTGLVKTVEDYLYASLWHALHLAEDVSSSDVGLKRTCEAVSRLGSLVKQWGPSYFEQEDDVDGSAASAVSLASQARGVARDKVPRSGGWAYALPLLACQQYGTALAYIAEVGGGLGLMQATHLGLVMDAVEITMDDYSLDSTDGNIEDRWRLFPMLASSFSASLQAVDVVAALKYLVVLSDIGKVMKSQVRRLVLESRQFEILAGKIEHDGTRSKAALDEYFSAKETSSLLAEAASEAIRVGKAADAAELLVLAGRYSALFSLMNRELASYLVATTDEEFNKRQFWFNAARQFHEVHLTGGKDYVQKNLGTEGNISLGNTFQLLLNLVVFFDRHREQQWAGAWDLVDYLELYPRVDSEMTIKVNAYNSLESCVRREFHHVVVASMEALCHLYRALKQSHAGPSVFQHSTSDQQLIELRTRARLLVTFSRLINLPLSGEIDTYAKLAQLEKNMM
eukprot:CCRYP_018878-RA/>CCRYP_018878-RA protein AED:0.03 eAED:0.03 QI:241/1/1/1/1/1/4/91/1031